MRFNVILIFYRKNIANKFAALFFKKRIALSYFDGFICVAIRNIVGVLNHKYIKSKFLNFHFNFNIFENQIKIHEKNFIPIAYNNRINVL